VFGFAGFSVTEVTGTSGRLPVMLVQVCPRFVVAKTWPGVVWRVQHRSRSRRRLRVVIVRIDGDLRNEADSAMATWSHWLEVAPASAPPLVVT
jgi:hypothetical protein